MAVKKHELVHENRNQLDLNALEQYIKLMNAQPHYLPAPHELVKNCQDIVRCLARTSGNENELWDLLTSVEEFLVRIVSSVNHNLRHEIITAVLDKFFSLISDPQSDASPATSVVLIVLDGSNAEATQSAARWLVQQGENGPAGAGLRASLSCLYRWLYEWRGTPSLGNWLIAFIKALEENERFDILIEVSIDNLSRLFTAMNEPQTLRQSVGDVILHVLASLRESSEALDMVAPHVAHVLVVLATESGQWSRTILQNIVDITTAMIDRMKEPLKGKALEMFKDKYAYVISFLEQYMATRSCQFLLLPPWRARNMSLTATNTKPPMRKVGLLNLGNTCYMNSVMQALLVTRQFSTHVVLRMTAAPYWARMGIVFSKMMHSVSTKLNPEEFFGVLKSPFFTRNNQHDSSEFLVYLFELLQSYEHESDLNFDYSRPAVHANRLRPMAINLSANSSSNDNERPESSRRAASPRPGSSAACSSTAALKRIQDQEIMPPPKKRMRLRESVYLRRDSFIDSIFGGVLLTRVECTECHWSSLSRDVFRDLQLAFPEKPQGWKHSVQTLLEFYCSKESLSGDNKYMCPDCGGLRDAERSVIIETTPKYLILVLKNFKFDPKLQVQTKLMHSVYYNHNIHLPTVRSQSDHSTYSLYAAIIHSGTTLDSGHYYTLAKDSDDWYIFNDEVASATDEHHLGSLNRSCTPYVLFYKRNDIDEGTAPSIEELPPRLQEKVMSHNKQYIETVRQMKINRP